MSLTYLKGIGTRYKNLLETEVRSADLWREEVSELEIEPTILKVNTCHSRFHQFCHKFEETIDRLSLALEEAKAEEEIQKLESESEMYFNLITEVTGRKEELKLYEQMLQEKSKQMSQPESDNKLEQLIDLQTQMLRQMTLQQKQQQIQQGQNCVKLPKLEIMSYNGDKQKFKEFWDQFECTVHRNTKLSDIEKFSYLKASLVKPRVLYQVSPYQMKIMTSQ